jgi:hypothetical protein
MSNGIGFIDSFAKVAGALTGAAGAGAMAPDIRVNPNIQTSINPQISPVFQQSYMPQNSAQTAGATQNMAAPMTAPESMASGYGYEPTAGGITDYLTNYSNQLSPRYATQPNVQYDANGNLMAPGSAAGSNTKRNMILIGGAVAVFGLIFYIRNR